MDGRVRFGVGLPQLYDPDLVARFARRAERLGFAHLWALDAVVGSATSHAPVLDGMHALTFAAAVTERIGLGMAVIVLPRRLPAPLAKELATVDRLSGGRLIAGVGLGYDDEQTAAGLGYPSGRRVLRLTEGIEVMRALWTQEEASFDGELFRFAGVRMGPKPLQSPHPPLWIGAGHPNALRRAVRLGDGWIGAGSFHGGVPRAGADREGGAARAASRRLALRARQADLHRRGRYRGPRPRCPHAALGRVLRP